MPQLEQRPQAAQPVTQGVVADGLDPRQAAWKLFVEQVERGERIDPLGQYVSKATRVSGQGKTRRPKVEPAARWYQRVTRRTSTGGTATTITAMTTQDTCDPTALECVGTGGDGGGSGGGFKTFTSSAGLGGSGYIHDLKIATVGVVEQTRYIKLEADLNKGAGGAYINLAFTRNASDVISGREYYAGEANSTPNDILTSFTTKIADGWWDLPSRNTNYFYMWAPTRATYTNLLQPYTAWDYQDLNDGAGGEYIYSFQSKSNQIPAYGGQISEIGILSGNSSTISPPAGWNKYPRDLNEGAGGDYIYFCYKY